MPSVIVEAQPSFVNEAQPSFVNEAQPMIVEVAPRPPRMGTLHAMMGRVAARPAGEAWLKEYMGRLRVFLPGLEWEPQEAAPPPPPRLVRALLPWRGGTSGEPKANGKASPDVTARMDTSTLNRMVKDLGDGDPVTLLVPDMPTLAIDMPALPVDATIETAALTLVEEVPAPSRATSRMHAEDPHKTLIGGSNSLPLSQGGRHAGAFEYGARRS